MGMTTDAPDRLYGAMDAAVVTPSDTADVSLTFFRGIIVGVAGAVKVTMNGTTTITFPNLVAGVIHPICGTRIWATGTTATGIVVVK